IGWWCGLGWGWGHWGFDWHNHSSIYNHNRYYSRSNTFYNRNNYYRGGGYRGVERGGRGEFNGAHAGERGGERGGVDGRRGAPAKPFNGDSHAARGYAQPRGQSGTRSGAFSGYEHGGAERSYSSRGGASFGGGGGFHGGGGHAGGGRH